MPEQPSDAKAHGTSAFKIWYAVAASCLTFVSALSLYREFTRHSLGPFIDSLARHYADVLKVIFTPISSLFSLNDVDRIGISIVAIFVAAFVRTFHSIKTNTQQFEELLLIVNIGVALSFLSFFASVLADGFTNRLITTAIVIIFVAVSFIFIIMIGGLLFSFFGDFSTIRVRLSGRFKTFSLIMLNISAAVAAIIVALLLDV